MNTNIHRCDYNNTKAAANPNRPAAPAPTVFPVLGFDVLVDELVAVADVLEALLEAVELAPLALALALVLALAELQTTESGTVTPAVLQMFCAYTTALAWSAALQAPARQQAMPEMKSLFEQMQAMSSDVQPAIEPPVVYCVTQVCAQVGSPFCADTRVASSAPMER